MIFSMGEGKRKGEAFGPREAASLLRTWQGWMLDGQQPQLATAAGTNHRAKELDRSIAAGGA